MTRFPSHVREDKVDAAALEGGAEQLVFLGL